MDAVDIEQVITGSTTSRRREARRTGVVALVVTLWILLVAGAGIWMAAAPFGPPFADPPPRNFAPPEMVVAAVVVIALCVVAGLGVRLVRPPYACWAGVVTAAVILLAATAATSSLRSLIVAVLLCATAWLTGAALIGSIGAQWSSWYVWGPLSFSLGLAVLSTAWLIVALAGWLNAAAVVVTSLAILTLAVALWIRCTGSRPTLPILTQPSTVSWFDVLLCSLLTGLVAFATLSAFVPENQSDATRQHLPIAREFWQAAGVPVIDSMPVSMQSIQNHVIFAVAYGLGDMTAAKLMQAAVGIACIIGVAGLAELAGGRSARLYGAAIFGAMPIVLWEIGHAFIDVLPVLLTVAAALCVVLWLEDSRWPWLITTGLLLSVGLASKLNMVVYIAAFAVGVALVGRASATVRDRIVALALLAAGGIVIIPWLLRTASAYGIATGTATISRLMGSAASSDAVTTGPAILGTPSSGPGLPAIAPVVASSPVLAQQFGHSPGDLLGMPWFLTFQGKDLGFPIIGRGEIGVALLMLVPLVLWAPRTRTTAMLGVLSVVSFIGWWASPYQIVRHLLPTLALGSAIVAAGVAGVLSQTSRSRVDDLLRTATRGGLLTSLILVPFFFVSSSRSQMPVAYLTGAETPEQYVHRAIRSAVALEATSALLPADTPVVYVGGPWEVPQLYSEARLLTVPREQLGPDAQAVFATFARIGSEHFVWNRADSPEVDWRTTALSTDFLRSYTRILAGDDDAYLFELMPAGNTTWGKDTVSNLLQDPRLRAVKDKRGPWRLEGKSVVADGVVALSRRATLTQQVAASPGHAYVLEAPMRCLDASGRGVVTFRWRDAAGAILDTDSEEVLPGRDITGQFLWRRAPEGAASVQAEFSMAGPARCEISGAALYDLG